MVLNEEQAKRYKRHILLKEIGQEGQIRLLQAKALIVGAGGLGSPVSMYLTAAGVGTIGIVDDDTVDLSNLQRQIVHGTSRLGMPKVESARKTLEDLNPDVNLKTYRLRLTEENVLALIGDYDVVINCIDNFATRFLLNDACVQTGKPMVEAGILHWDGMLMTVVPGRGPCYRCIFPAAPGSDALPSIGEAGVVGVVPGVMGVLQATEALKLLAGVGENLVGKLLLFDALETKFREVEVQRNPSCPVCGGSIPQPLNS